MCFIEIYAVLCCGYSVFLIMSVRPTLMYFVLTATLIIRLFDFYCSIYPAVC